MQYKYNPVNYSSSEDLSIPVETRKASRKKFTKSRVEENAKEFSNEQTALEFFDRELRGARIYDLDAIPVDTKNWYELENMKIYYNFLKENKSKFEE